MELLSFLANIFTDWSMLDMQVTLASIQLYIVVHEVKMAVNI